MKHSINFVKVIMVIYFSMILSCQLVKKDPITIGTNLWIGYEPLYVAKNINILPDDKFRLILFPSAEDVMRAYRNGVIDIAAVTADEMLNVAAKLPETRAFLITDFSNGADVIMARPPAKSMKDLINKKIGYEAGALGVFMLSRALTLNNMETKEITPIDISLASHIKAYDNNDIDAIVTFEPRKSILSKKGAVNVFSSKEIPGEIIDLLVTRDETLKKRKEEITELVDIWFKAVKYIEDEEDLAADFISKRQKLSPEDIKQSLKDIKIPGKKESYKFFNDKKGLEEKLKLISAVLSEAGMMLECSNVNQYLDDSFLKD